ncbi:MAG TPA: DUF58 domain-containing protein [Cyclobacteriaceae bacterium]|mgnify:CR=1 FL=1|nr:DUF58 domain-containing protein [Cytophagales bacterium]HMR57499.1 DUF58 domain-containing protein [Cyclobacteriaceae bacterium]HRE66719.1 DUF58 domain-containing protein [Cyclobacteriaceae bacterium]HRF33533.1 DUF58 domain-containing protein [Cyclobacteriaceae bacterium]
MKALLKKLRKYEIQIRKAINSQMQGDFRSIFKGTGLEFDDVRPYQYGDDIRTIDWNVSAKGHGTFVKTFREEKEQTIYFILDVSASQFIGTRGRTKFDIATEICGVLALSGAKESSQVGLICYSDTREKFLKPKKGMAQAYEIIASLERLTPVSPKTNLNRAITFALNSIKRRSVIILISDFIDEGYEHHLKSLARKHDLVMIQISDKRETQLPKLGTIPVLDKESKKTIWVNSSFGDFRSKMIDHHSERQQALINFSKKHQVNFLSLSTEEDYVPRLLRLFKVRNKSVKSA